MNCKPGDLAVTHSMPMDNGIVVEVIRAVDNSGGWEYLGPCWRVKSLGSRFHLTPTRLSEIADLPDANLRPIRDPGEDAQDETLSWLSVPTREGVAA